MRSRLEESATRNQRSLSREIEVRLELSLRDEDQDARARDLLKAIRGVLAADA
jgi:hypothetical protein